MQRTCHEIMLRKTSNGNINKLPSDDLLFPNVIQHFDGLFVDLASSLNFRSVSIFVEYENVVRLLLPHR